MKTLKFKPHLVGLIKSGKKSSTWRLFDDKDLKVGDEVGLCENGVDEPFAEATITKIVEKPLGSLTDKDWEGHERFESEEEMYATYRKYYGPTVNSESKVKIIWFETLAK